MLAATSLALLCAGCGGSGGSNNGIGGGGGGGGGATSPTPPATTTPPAAAPGISLLAGAISGPGNLDGSGAQASFATPLGLARDSAGNLHVADNFNRTIRKITPDGVVSTLAGTPGQLGGVDGQGAAARFADPRGVAVDAAGNVYVADGAARMVRKITPTGRVSTLAGSGAVGTDNGPGATASFARPLGVAVDGAGNVYVTDTETTVGYGLFSYTISSHSVRKITPQGVVSTLAGNGVKYWTDGLGAQASFTNPTGITIDGAGNLYVVDAGNCTLRKITPEGMVSTPVGTPRACGAVDGTGAAAQLSWPQDVTIAPDGTLYVTENGPRPAVRKVSPAGVVTTLARDDGLRGVTARATSQVYGVAVDAAGTVYLADSGDSVVRKLSAAGVPGMVAGLVAHYYHADASGGDAHFFNLQGLLADGTGGLLAADQESLRRVSADGTVSTVAPLSGFYTYSFARDGQGALYAAKQDKVYKVSPAGVASLLAGGAYSPPGQVLDGAGAAASFAEVGGLVAAPDGTLYVADKAANLLRTVSPAGLVTTWVGMVPNPEVLGSTITAGFTDGQGTATRFNHPTQMAMDGAGNVYTLDESNAAVRKVTPGGWVTTVVAAAALGSVTAMAVDAAGNVYVAISVWPASGTADTGAQRLYKVTPAGGVTLLAGTSGPERGTRLGALPGVLPRITSLALGNGGVVYAGTDSAVLKIHPAQ